MPAPVLRHMMSDPQLNRIFMSKVAEHMVRMNMIDLPRFGGLDQQSLRDLRTPAPQGTLIVSWPGDCL